MPRRRIIRRTMGKDAIKKSGTLISLIGPSTAPIPQMDIVIVPERSSAGGITTIRDLQDTDVQCNVGDVVKYVNLRIQVGPHGPSGEPEDDESGWLEWAVVKRKEGTLQIQNTNIGTNTLGDVCTKTFRGDTLLHGAIPVGGDQPNVTDIVIKIPKIFCKLQQGSGLRLYFYFRSTNNASVATDLVGVVTSFYYKNYV